MIEKLLRPFVSKETKIVLDALEAASPNVVEDYHTTAESWYHSAYRSMYTAQMDSAGFIERLVLILTYTRLQRGRVRREKQMKAAALAGKFLVGEKDFS